MDRTRPSPTTPRISKRVRPAGTTPKHLRNRDVTRYDIDTLTGQNDDDDEDYGDYLPPLPPPLEIPEDFYSPLHKNYHEWGSRQKALWFTPRGSSSNPATLSYDADEAEAEASDSVKIPDDVENDVFIVESSDDEICAENLTSGFGEFSLHEDRRLHSPFDSDDAEITTFGVVPGPLQGTSYTTTAKRKNKVQQSLLPAKTSLQPVSIVADGINTSQVEHDFGDDDESMSGSDLGGAMLGYSPSTDIVVILSDHEDGISSPSCDHHANLLHMPKGQSDVDEQMYDLEDDYQNSGFLTHNPSFEPPISLLSCAKSSSREPSSTQSRPPLKGRLDDTNTGAVGSKSRENKRKPIPKSQVSGLNQTKKSQPAPKVPVMPDYSAMTLPELKTIAKKYGFRATSRNIMVPQLELVWNTLHPTSQSVASQQPELPVAVTSKDARDVVSKSATTAPRKEGKLKRNQDCREIMAEVDEIRSEIVSYQKGVRDSSNDSDRVLNSGVDGEDEDGLDEDEDEDEDNDEDDLGDNEGVLLELGHLTLPKDDRSSAVVMPKRSVEERLSEFIKRDREWYGRVLRYEVGSEM